ncbi:MAG: zinc-ribbon domain-containing protein [Clostridiales bacterium]|jgi:uncharacterized membrane protein YvbJ|nr:zinc-ribbon domain-containing protein [Clostridiales bacterium]
MFCNNCGAQHNPDVRFCGSCGTFLHYAQHVSVPVTDAANIARNNRSRTPRVHRKKNLIIALCGALAVIALAVTGILLFYR